ncbi:MAG TPA: ATP-dependent Clp protease proteolytic subunit [Dehalococcoidia bacterium]
MGNTDNTLYVKWFAPVNDATTQNLMGVLDDALNNGVQHVVLLISSPGGNVYNGLSAHNYLRGLPIEVTTHNFGSCDSIGAVVFCAGSKRFSVPHARFLLHGVQMQFGKGGSLEETQLEERLKSLRSDTGNIAGVIASAAGKSVEDVHEAMRQRTVLSAEEALAFGLVHEVKEALVPSGARLLSIQLSAPSAPTP